MTSYAVMGTTVRGYLEAISATDAARPHGHFAGGAVLELAEDHLLVVIHPHARLTEDQVRSNAIGYLQDRDLGDWLIVDEAMVGPSLAEAITVMHIHPQPKGK